MTSRGFGCAVATLLATTTACHSQTESRSDASPPAPSHTHEIAEAREPPAPTPRATSSAEAPLPPVQASEPDEPPRPEEPCGSVVVDGERIPLECGDSDFTGLAKDAADEVVSRNELQPKSDLAGAMPLPDNVDHRREGTEGPMRSQGRTFACTAFSLASAIDHALLRRASAVPAVSVLHLWSRYHKGNSALAIETNIGQPITRESDWPFDAKLACAWEPASKSECVVGSARVTRGQPVDAALVAKADAKPYARIQHVTNLEHPSATVLKEILAKGQDVWLGMSIGDGPFRKVTASNPVIADFDPGKAKGGHRFLLSGYRVQSNGTYFLLHNSWGPKWADGGYAWIHDKTLRAVKHAVIVDAIPDAGSHLPRPPVATPHPKCPKSEVPDSVSRGCAPACADGSARFDGICPETKGCKSGEVNMSGACVVAAPTGRGVSSKTGVEFDCHAGGCVYTIPKGTLGCTAASCTHACPAPGYVLVHGAKGLSCSE